jgi:hypothetical protein
MPAQRAPQGSREDSGEESRRANATGSPTELPGLAADPPVAAAHADPAELHHRRTAKTSPLTRVVVACVVVVIAASGVLLLRFARLSEHRRAPSAGSSSASSAQPPTRSGGVTESSDRSPATGPMVATPRVPKSAAREQPPTATRRTSTTFASTTDAAIRPADAGGPATTTASPPASGIVPSSTPPDVASAPDVGVAHNATAPAPVSNRALPTAGTSLTRESLALDEVLRRYEQAYDRLDAQAAAAIWSSVDSRALARAFSLLRHQDLEFGECGVAMTDSTATAQCPGQLRYTRRIGDSTPKVEQHVWTIEFARAGEAWRIVRVSAR